MEAARVDANPSYVTLCDVCWYVMGLCVISVYPIASPTQMYISIYVMSQHLRFDGDYLLQYVSSDEEFSISHGINNVHVFTLMTI